jgi:hypothetical protein
MEIGDWAIVSMDHGMKEIDDSRVAHILVS